MKRILLIPSPGDGSIHFSIRDLVLETILEKILPKEIPDFFETGRNLIIHPYSGRGNLNKVVNVDCPTILSKRLNIPAVSIGMCFHEEDYSRGGEFWHTIAQIKYTNNVETLIIVASVKLLNHLICSYTSLDTLGCEGRLLHVLLPPDFKFGDVISYFFTQKDEKPFTSIERLENREIPLLLGLPKFLIPDSYTDGGGLDTLNDLNKLRRDYVALQIKHSDKEIDDKLFMKKTQKLTSSVDKLKVFWNTVVA